MFKFPNYSKIARRVHDYCFLLLLFCNLVSGLFVHTTAQDTSPVCGLRDTSPVWVALQPCLLVSVGKGRSCAAFQGGWSPLGGAQAGNGAVGAGAAWVFTLICVLTLLWPGPLKTLGSAGMSLAAVFPTPGASKVALPVQLMAASLWHCGLDEGLPASAGARVAVVLLGCCFLAKHVLLGNLGSAP